MIIKKISQTNKLFNICKSRLTNPIKRNVCDTFSADIYKSRCINALKSENPHELAFIIDKKSGQCLGSFVGDEMSCAVDIPKTSSSLILLHGHPQVNGSSMPVSLKDFLLMNESNIDKIVAYNNKGEFSFLQKTSAFRQLSHDEVVKLRAEYMRHIVKTASKEEAQKIDDLARYCVKHKGSELVKQGIAERLSALQYKSGGIIVDNFWKDLAPKLNLEYFSNFR